jgi:hypothetical protein
MNSFHSLSLRSHGDATISYKTRCITAMSHEPDRILRPNGTYLAENSETVNSLLDECLLQVRRDNIVDGGLGRQRGHGYAQGAVSVAQAVPEGLELAVSVSDTNDVSAHLLHQDAVGHVRLADTEHTARNLFHKRFRVLAPDLHLLLREALKPVINVVSVATHTVELRKITFSRPSTNSNDGGCGKILGRSDNAHF